MIFIRPRFHQRYLIFVMYNFVYILAQHLIPKYKVSLQDSIIHFHSPVAICRERAVPMAFPLYCFYFSAALIVGVCVCVCVPFPFGV